MHMYRCIHHSRHLCHERSIWSQYSISWLCWFNPCVCWFRVSAQNCSLTYLHHVLFPISLLSQSSIQAPSLSIYAEDYSPCCESIPSMWYWWCGQWVQDGCWCPIQVLNNWCSRPVRFLTTNDDHDTSSSLSSNSFHWNVWDIRYEHTHFPGTLQVILTAWIGIVSLDLKPARSYHLWIYESVVSFNVSTNFSSFYFPFQNVHHWPFTRLKIPQDQGPFFWGRRLADSNDEALVSHTVPHLNLEC